MTMTEEKNASNQSGGSLDLPFNPKAMLSYAYHWATKSPDPSSQCGALVLNQDGELIGTACNGLTNGVRMDLMQVDRDTKLAYVEHAERGALFDVLANVDLPPSENMRVHYMVAPWAACIECARAIVQSGIRVLVRHKDAQDRTPERWRESIRIADEIMLTGGVEIIDYEGPVGAEGVLNDGKIWYP